MIDNIFGNKTNILILRFMSKFDSQKFTKEEIAKETGAGLRNIYDSLGILSYEKILEKINTHGRIYYRFVVDSKVKEIIYSFFEEERVRLALRSVQLSKILSEIESKIIKVAGSNLIDIILFGSVAKGRDTAGSDLDLCVIISKDSKEKIKQLQFEDYGRELQLHVFTSKEFIQAKQKKNPLIRDILRDGISLRIGK